MNIIKNVIADNSAENITAIWDGVRFALVLERKDNDISSPKLTIILNPIEAMTLLKFLGNCGKED